MFVKRSRLNINVYIECNPESYRSYFFLNIGQGAHRIGPSLTWPNHVMHSIRHDDTNLKSTLGFKLVNI